jgi:hypothetical protein
MFDVTRIVWDMSLPLSAGLRPIRFPKFNHAQDLLRSCLAQPMQCPSRPTFDLLEDSHVTNYSMSSHAAEGFNAVPFSLRDAQANSQPLSYMHPQ